MAGVVDPVLAQGAIILFEPESGWKWESWDGKVKAASERILMLEGKPVILKSDLEKLKDKLAEKSYKAKGFDDIPGNIASAIVRVTESTLSNVVECQGEFAATVKTKGTFTVSCIPSFKAGSPPVPDPIATRSGKWRAEQAGQVVTHSS
jgi:hypothetical protein